MKKRAIAARTFELGLTAEEHPDGTFTLKDLPVFGEVAADSNGNKIAATPEWLRAALDRSLKLQSEGFAGPVHVGHHTKWDALGQAKDERERVGALVLRDLRPMKVEGKVEQTLFADVTDISADAFARIQKGELPHVSVEYIEEHRPAIDSLAMTGSACPFKRYPNIKIAKVVKAPKATAYTVVSPPAPSAPRGITYLTGGQMPAEEAKKETATEEKKDAPPAVGNEGNDGMKQQTEKQTGQPGQPAEQVEAVPTWAAAIVQGYGVLVQTLQAIAQKIGAPFTPGAPSGPATLPSTSMPAAVHTVTELAPAMDAKTFGDLMGRVAVVEKDLKDREREKTVSLSVATFEAKVKGWPFDDSDRAALRKCVEAGGDVAAQAFISQVQKRPKELVNKADDFRAQTSVAPDSPAVMKFVAQGPVALEQARKYSAMHAQLVAAGYAPSTEDKFIENQFASAAANARANAITKGDR